MRRLSVPSLPPIFWIFGALLLVMDLGLLALYVAWKLEWLQDVAFDVGHDRGASEVFQYAKMLWIGLCAAGMAWRTRQPVYVALGALFLGLLADDAGMLHERVGEWLGAALRLPAVAGLQPHDFGEIAFVALWVAPLFLAGVVAYRRSDPAARSIAWAAFIGLVVLAGFGVGVDVIHQSVTSLYDVHGLHSLLSLVEEGGEMVVMTVLAAGAIAVVSTTLDPPAGPRQGLASGDGYAGDVASAARTPSTSGA